MKPKSFWRRFWGDGSLMVIKSAEGRRTCKPTKEERDQLERAGIKRVGKLMKKMARRWWHL